MNAGVSEFDCFKRVSRTTTYVFVVGLFIVWPLLAFRPGYFDYLPGFNGNATFIWIIKDWGHVIRNIFLIVIILHLMEVG